MDPQMYKQRYDHCEFTINNWTEEELVKLRTFELSRINYICWGQEVGEQGTAHLQGYLQLNCTSTGRQIQVETCKRIFLKKCKDKNAEGMINYCKEDGLFEERGIPRLLKKTEKVKKEKKKKDPLDYKKLIQEDNLTMRDLCATHFLNPKNVIPYYQSFELPRPTGKIDIIWICGVSEVGKSKYARQLSPDLHNVVPSGSGSSEFWGSYDKHEAILFDDFHENWFGYDRLKQILDLYPIQINCKYGERQALWKKIYITSELPPHLMYKKLKKTQLYQLLRRITRLVYIDINETIRDISIKDKLNELNPDRKELDDQLMEEFGLSKGKDKDSDSGCSCDSFDSLDEHGVLCEHKLKKPYNIKKNEY